MPLYYHYTDEEGAQNIIRSSRIMASVKFMAGGDTAFGNGVYLTKLDPESSTKAEIARNNWMNTGAQFIKDLNKTKYYFVFNIPDSDVEDATSGGRNIFLFGNNSDLRLVKYPWWLKDFDTGRIIVSYKYKVTSLGPASLVQGGNMGNYVITDDAVNARPVYFCEDNKKFLFMTRNGNWTVGLKAGVNLGSVMQVSKNSLGPDVNLPWEYNGEGKWKKTDDTLKAYPWQL